VANPERHTSRLRVLIAEDDAAVREALAEMVAGEALLDLVAIAADATEAIELAATRQPDVALIDVRMPGGGGLAAVRGISKQSPGTKMIALSAEGERSTVLQMLEAGVLGYLVKGGSVDEIVEAIKRASDGQATLSVEITGDVIEELVGQLNTRTRTQKKRRVSEERIRRTLGDQDRLGMVFQPIVALADRQIVGAEALARFVGPPKRGPSLWFAEASTVGLRVELELAAARKAIEALPGLPDSVYLTINVSPTTLARSSFFKLVSESDASRLVAEITEHAPIQDYDRLATASGKLRSLGMRLAVDDAGAGFASMRHILKLSPDLIKLDVGLIRNIQRDRSKQSLAAGLISFAKKSGATIVAEGIERAAELDTLVELGVRHGQGYYLGKPGPLPLTSRPRRPLARAHVAVRMAR
jgi:EAL domain-containing protein (putative c-di-GMP-specific phosphodiesterase class I)/DNA-binding NarL/FixJ family response regulator